MEIVKSPGMTSVYCMAFQVLADVLPQSFLS